MRRIICVLTSLLTLAACASEPRRPPSALDPSSPDAPESPPASLPSALAAPVASQSAGSEQGHAGHGSAAPSCDAGTSAAPPGTGHAHHGGPDSSRDAGAATVYTCAMHPEVRSDKPGTCPKCGMKLMPEQPGAGGATDAGQPPAGHDHGAHP
jgi:hypothetical protein